LYNKSIVKKYRKDNIEFMKKSKENNIVREDHVKLLVNGERSITCLYAHGEKVKVNAVASLCTHTIFYM
jgi:hypothetical protein